MRHVGLRCANPTYGAPVGAEAATFTNVYTLRPFPN